MPGTGIRNTLRPRAKGSGEGGEPPARQEAEERSAPWTALDRAGHSPGADQGSWAFRGVTRTSPGFFSSHNVEGREATKLHLA